MIFLYLNSTSKNENTEALYYHMTVLELILVYYMFMEFVDSKFVDENGLQPYKNIKGHIYLCTSLNIPMTRWTTIHNWTAEKIRRKLHNGKSL